VIALSLKRGAKVRRFLQTTKHFHIFFRKKAHFFSFLVKNKLLRAKKLVFLRQKLLSPTQDCF